MNRKIKSLGGLLWSIALIYFMAAGVVEGKTEAEEEKEKMLRDTFSFFRGDIQSFYDYSLAHKPSPGQSDLAKVQLHGDPHIENFGLWVTEGGLKFGLIDFDETTRGPFYLDLERLAIGLVLLSHERGIEEDKKIIQALFKSYLSELEKFQAGQAGTDSGVKLRESYPLVKKLWERGEKVSRQDLLNGYGATFLNEKGERAFRIRDDFVPLDTKKIEPALQNYLASLPEASRKEREFYRIKDAVEVKRCGLGSLGYLKYRLLIEGPSLSQGDDYILEFREAKVSALALPADYQALRIYQGQKIIQGNTSPSLGYTRWEGKDFLVDEVYPGYSTVKAEDLKDLKDFLDLAEVGGQVLAQAHSRTNSELSKAASNILGEIEKTILDYSYISELKTLASRLHEAQKRWMDSLEDKFSEEALARAYKEMQAYSRNFLKKNNSFKIEEMAVIAEEVRYPYEVYYNDLYIEANRLKEQLFNITTPGTVANSYYQRPSEKNLTSLKTLFDRIYQYYTGKSYSWNRYLNKYLFQKSRLEHYLKEWHYWDEQYRLSPSLPIRERAEFCYKRLKKEGETNNLPLAGEVNAFYLSRDFDDYYEELKQQEELDKIRREKGGQKEVVVLVHGLGEDRSSWKALPSLLAEEDAVNPGLKKYFKVYLFRFDTIEDSKSVSNFTRELSGFIREVQDREKAEKVNIIAHSLGGVLSLQYLSKNTDPDFDLRPPRDEKRPLVSSAEVLEGFLADKYRNNIKRFIALAPSFSGSKVANVAVEMFRKPEAWFQESLKALDKGDVPSKGDIQVEENQLGSAVNLDSFRRLDLERPLDPLNLAALPPVERKLSLSEKKGLEEKEVRALTIIGVPPRTTSRGEEDRGKKEFGISEDDGLVRVYSANPNHNYFIDNEFRKNIGYQKSSVQYLPLGHFELIEISSRAHPAYKYIVSFLNDDLLPWEAEKPLAIQTFGVVLRVAPAEIEEGRGIFFTIKPLAYYSQEKLMTLPALEIELVKDDPDFSPGIIMQEEVWNNKTGAFFAQGSFSNAENQGRVVYRLKAQGYKTRTASIPITRGQLTYAPHIVLEKNSL